MPRLAVLGHPVAHSRSPAMHNAALEAMGLADEWSYEAIDVAPEGFEHRVRAMPREGFTGANVTVPHKLAARAIADRPSRAVSEIGAANTLSFSGEKIVADNTDAIGITAPLPLSPRGKRALVLGAGGSARAAVWALRRAGADVAIWNRTPERAKAVARDLGATPVGLGEWTTGGPGGDASLPVQDFDLVVNATSVGMGAGPDSVSAALKALHLPADGLTPDHVVVDLVYGTLETPLTAAARARGATVIDGVEVLVHQGAASLRLWTGDEPPIDTMRRAARDSR